MAQELIELPPDPARMANALRGFGYEFGAALCDLIDNSIAAEADTIWIDVRLDSDNIAQVKVVDNGFGMDHPDLKNAMRLGSREREEEGSLGKFGFGLKTASTAFAPSFTVVSLKRGKGQNLVSATYDVDEIAKSNKWLIEIGDPEPDQKINFEDDLEELREMSFTKVKTGTVVYWNRVDRLLQKKDGGAFGSQQQALGMKVSQAIKRISLVFQRFLDFKDERAANVSIYVTSGDNKYIEVEPYDPFLESYRGAEIDEKIPVKDDSGKVVAHFRCRGFVLPDYRDIGLKQSEVRWGANNQGIYCYRNDRLVDGPDWFETDYTSDTHTNAARFELSFDEDLDEVFGLSVTKDKLEFPADTNEIIKDLVTPIYRESNKQSRGRTKRLKDEAARKKKSAADDRIGKTYDDGRLEAPQIRDGEKGKAKLMDNNTLDPVPIADEKGQPSLFAVLPDETPENRHVEFTTSLPDGTLWEPAIGKGYRKIKVKVNSEHPWFKTQFNEYDMKSGETEGLEYLLFSLAVAEGNNTDLESADVFAQLRRDVSHNLRELVKHLDDK